MKVCRLLMRRNTCLRFDKDRDKGWYRIHMLEGRQDIGRTQVLRTWNHRENQTIWETSTETWPIWEKDVTKLVVLNQLVSPMTYLRKFMRRNEGWRNRRPKRHRIGVLATTSGDVLDESIQHPTLENNQGIQISVETCVRVLHQYIMGEFSKKWLTTKTILGLNLQCWRRTVESSDTKKDWK